MIMVTVMSDHVVHGSPGPLTDEWQWMTDSQAPRVECNPQPGPVPCRRRPVGAQIQVGLGSSTSPSSFQLLIIAMPLTDAHNTVGQPMVDEQLETVPRLLFPMPYHYGLYPTPNRSTNAVALTTSLAVSQPPHTPPFPLLHYPYSGRKRLWRYLIKDSNSSRTTASTPRKWHKSGKYFAIATLGGYQLNGAFSKPRHTTVSNLPRILKQIITQVFLYLPYPMRLARNSWRCLTRRSCTPLFVVATQMPAPQTRRVTCKEKFRATAARVVFLVRTEIDG